jgi:hypothetical protein
MEPVPPPTARTSLVFHHLNGATRLRMRFSARLVLPLLPIAEPHENASQCV